MKTRVPKVWCERCKFMVFVGECPHARSVAPARWDRVSAYWKEKGVDAAAKVIGSLKAMIGFPPGIKP